ncbi:brain-specific angiogenesis inhibitor 1-associated protein 2-like protein 2 isoform X2 [Passer domesticus]|uniref:brain-specific angiogenesis inhibitor 1-associated protein 2-like protein 2 isoform X2 n=1 Tax=Passer domesticus TaxID=48849 RepID=UPI0030FF22E8
MDLSYRSTISIYKSILEQFNPALENLVYLGNNYLRAFHALSKAAEVYFKAIEKIGEQALQSSTSHMLGEILMQMSDAQRLLSSDLEVVAQTFHVDLLQHMEKNSKMDVQFISESQKQYELEYQRRATNLDKCMAELWRMERARDKNAREMKENVMRLRSEMQAFVSESQREAELEEKRRYRFLAEKHQMLYNTLLQFYSRARGMIQSKAPRWKEQLEASRNPSNSHSQGLLSASHGQGYPSGRLTPTHLEMPQRPLGEFASSVTGSRSSIFSPDPPEMRMSPQPESPRRPLRRTPSAASVAGSLKLMSSLWRIRGRWRSQTPGPSRYAAVTAWMTSWTAPARRPPALTGLLLPSPACPTHLPSPWGPALTRVEWSPRSVLAPRNQEYLTSPLSSSHEVPTPLPQSSCAPQSPTTARHPSSGEAGLWAEDNFSTEGGGQVIVL